MSVECCADVFNVRDKLDQPMHGTLWYAAVIAFGPDDTPFTRKLRMGCILGVWNGYLPRIFLPNHFNKMVGIFYVLDVFQHCWLLYVSG